MSTDLPGVRRIGVTMRVDCVPPHQELRDAMAHDWGAFLSTALPGVAWLPVPNLGRSAVQWARSWALDGFILTGGNDIGSVTIRDETELAILAHAAAEQLPVFGVCRGLQLIHHAFGGELAICPAAEHVACEHTVRFTGAVGIGELRGACRTVNSFHRFGVRREDLANGLLPTAVTEDGWVEGVSSRQNRLHAVMWHPERQRPFHEADVRLVRHVFGCADD